MSKESKMAKKGVDQGNMSPVVDSFQEGSSGYFMNDANKTTEYIERRNKIESKQASGIKKQEYKGRYD